MWGSSAGSLPTMLRDVLVIELERLFAPTSVLFTGCLLPDLCYWEAISIPNGKEIVTLKTTTVSDLWFNFDPKWTNWIFWFSNKNAFNFLWRWWTDFSWIFDLVFLFLLVFMTATGAVVECRHSHTTVAKTGFERCKSHDQADHVKK
jgi:hypothetical protein